MVQKVTDQPPLSKPDDSFGVDSGNAPFVSVIMPIRNEASFIASSLAAILNQDYPKDRFEVIVSDGMSEDGTREAIESLLKSRSPSDEGPAIKIIQNTAKIVPAGLNAAIQQATGEIIIRMDGHAIARPDYISKAVDTILNHPEVENVGGTIRTIGRGYVGKSIALAMNSWVGAGNSKFRISSTEQFVDTVPFGAFRKKTLFRIGLFNEEYVRHQDYELNYRLRKHGAKILLIPAMQSDYYVRESVFSLFKQYFQYGIGKGKLLRSHPDSMRLHHAAPPLLVLFLVLGSVVAFAIPGLRSIILLSFGAYTLLITVSALVLSFSRQRIKYFPLLPLIFLCLHLGYGSGLFIGFFKRGKRRA